MKECCDNCKHLGEIYVPPTTEHEPFYMDGCFLYTYENLVMYLEDTMNDRCECFSPKEVVDV